MDAQSASFSSITLPARHSIRALGASTYEVARQEKFMKKDSECYYVFLDLRGPEKTYQPLFEVLNKLRAQKLEHGFPIWCFSGELDSHDKYRTQLEAVLPGWSVYEPEIKYSFLFMSARGYTSAGEYQPIAM
jgi:hypothetical protein